MKKFAFSIENHMSLIAGFAIGAFLNTGSEQSIILDLKKMQHEIIMNSIIRFTIESIFIFFTISIFAKLIQKMDSAIDKEVGFDLMSEPYLKQLADFSIFIIAITAGKYIYFVPAHIDVISGFDYFSHVFVYLFILVFIFFVGNICIKKYIYKQQ